MNLLGSVLTELLPVTILLVALVLVGGVIILRARKMAKGSLEEVMPFTLAQLRKLHKNGELSDEEFERAKSSVVNNARNNDR